MLLNIKIFKRELSWYDRDFMGGLENKMSHGG